MQGCIFHEGYTMAGKTKHQRKRYAAEHAFAKFLALNGLIAEGGDLAKDARKAKKRMADHWGKRSNRNTGDMYRESQAKPGAVVEVQV
jgi:hypothetical protein